MTEDQKIGLVNIASCNKKLAAFRPVAGPELMRELTEAVERHVARVKAFHKLP